MRLTKIRFRLVVFLFCFWNLVSCSHRLSFMHFLSSYLIVHNQGVAQLRVEVRDRAFVSRHTQLLRAEPVRLVPFGLLTL